MKLQLKALSITLGLAALLGACNSVNSSTPSTTTPEDSVQLESTETETTEGTVVEPAVEVETPEETAAEGTVVEPNAEVETPEESESAEQMTPETEPAQ